MTKNVDYTEKIKLDARFEELSETIGRDLALYCFCAVFDLPFKKNSQKDAWSLYLRGMKGTELHFVHGVVDIDDVISDDLAEEERWLKDWGEGDPKNPYTENQYRQLDGFYKTMTGQLDSIGSLTKQQEDTARTCALWALQRAERSAKGDKESIDIAAKLDKLIRDNLADCNMRSRDILPTQEHRVDGIVDALRKKFGLRMEMSKDDVLEAFYSWCKSKKYPQTVDAEEKAILAIIQTMQKNSDLPVDQDLPEYAKMTDFSFEFAEMPNEEEKETYNYLGLVRGD